MKAITLISSAALAAFTLAAAAAEPAKDSPPFRELREKIAKAKAEGREDEARRLMEEAKKMHGGPGHREKMMAEKHEHIEKAKREIEELKKAGKQEEAKHLAQRLEARMRGPRGGPGKEKFMAGHREEMEKARKQIEELHRAGKHDEAGKMRERFMAEMKARHGRPHDGPPPQGPAAEGEGPARLRHLMAAIGHLQDAGLGEPAEQLEKMARKMRGELEAQHRAREEHGRAEEPRKHDGPPKHEAARHPGPDELHRLQEQVQKMAHAIDELREAVKKQQPREEVRKAD